jgi:hypothetical protein
LPNQNPTMARSFSKKDFGSRKDGRPPWFRHRTLLPAPEALDLAKRVLPVVIQAIEKNKRCSKVDPGDWLEDYLVNIADEFLRARRYRLLPKSDYYREYVDEIRASAESLLALIRQAPNDAVWDLTLRVRREMGLELRQTTRTVDGKLLDLRGFEATLDQFIRICEASSNIAKGPGPRRRDDLVCAAAGLADLWTKLTGQRFPKTLSVLEGISGLASPGEPEFKSPGPRFVRELLPAFDGNVTFAEVRTALKHMHVKPPLGQG